MSKDLMPHHIKPMLATLVGEPFDSKDFLFEIKWDGFRAIAEVKGKKVNLYSRNQLSFNKIFAPIVKSLENSKLQAVLDGEVVVLDKQGKAQFQLLQNYQNTGKGNVIYFVFDILYYGGKDLRKLPLLDRKNILKKVLPKVKNIKYSDHVLEKGKSFYKAAQKQDLEGLVAKNTVSPYRAGMRTLDWQKIKVHQRQETIIGGFTEPRGSRKKFGALVLGVMEEGKLKYIGHTGGGFDDESLQQIYQKLKPLIQKNSPFEQVPKTNAPVTWVKPKLIAEVSLAEWTGDGHMRQPIFLGLRNDKSAKQVVREQPKQVSFAKEKNPGVELQIGDRRVKVTHLSKVYWPKEKYTKGDLIEYYRKVAKFMLPYLRDRPESLNRHPHGINGPSFFQKNVADTMPTWVETESIYSESNKKPINYLVCQDEATLAYMANLGCIEINPWNSRIGHLDNPDYCVIDLDPEDISFEKVIEVAQETHKILDKLKIPNYCKTSGATGIHIYIPLGAKYDYDQTREFARLLVTIINKRLPNITSIERSPKKRQKKIYLDFLQNRKGQTLAAPYSVRPKPGAPVSTPLDWREVKKGLKPSDFTIKNIEARLKKKGDLWKPVLGKGVNLLQTLKKLEN